MRRTKSLRILQQDTITMEMFQRYGVAVETDDGFHPGPMADELVKRFQHLTGEPGWTHDFSCQLHWLLTTCITQIKDVTPAIRVRQFDDFTLLHEFGRRFRDNGGLCLHLATNNPYSNHHQGDDKKGGDA